MVDKVTLQGGGCTRLQRTRVLRGDSQRGNEGVNAVWLRGCSAEGFAKGCAVQKHFGLQGGKAALNDLWGRNSSGRYSLGVRNGF